MEKQLNFLKKNQVSGKVNGQKLKQKAKVTTPGWVKSKSISIGSKVEKHIGRHPKKYIAGASAVAGAGVYSEHQKQKKMGTHARLKKELKRKGFI